MAKLAHITVGTTPTIIYTFSLVDPADFSKATLTVMQNDEIIIEKTLPDATVEEDNVSWTLTQAETLLLEVGGYGTIMLNWLTVDGVRGVGKTIQFIGDENHISEVMT